MSKKFIIEKHSRIDKSFGIIAPSDMDIYMRVGFDDVDHPTVSKEAKIIVNILNENLDRIRRERR